MTHHKFGLALSALLLLVGARANAATYFVDAVAGNDAASGLAATGDAVSGPWRTVGRVNQALLKPGDAVLFKCGQAWNETLAPTQSGLAGQPIRFGSQPFGCADKPRITGFETIYTDAWTRDADGAWRTTLPRNLIRNGALVESVSNWRVASADGSARLWLPSNCVNSGQRCMAAIAGPSAAVVSSPTFAVTQGQSYRIRFTARAEPKKSVNVALRVDGSAPTTLAPVQAITGDGAWHTYDVVVTPTASATARLDFDVAAAVITYIRGVSARVDATPAAPLIVADATAPLETAHFPNRGSDAAKPNSVYLPLATSSPAVVTAAGRYVSTTLNIGVPANLPAGASIVPGLGVTVRNNMWAISSHKIAAVSADGKTLTLDTPTTYPLSFVGLGYYLTGARWMLDANGEWFYDAAAGALSVRIWSGQGPGDQVRTSSMAAGINVKARSYIVLEDLAVSGAVEGVQASNTESIELRRLSFDSIADTAVSALAAKNLKMDSAVVNGAGRVAFLGWDSDGVAITNSEFRNIGINVVGGQRMSLPRQVETALTLGTNAVISGNRLSNLGYGGANAGANSTISDNSITDLCLSLNDCGAVMLDKLGSGSTVSGNLIQRAEGNVDGLPAVFYSHSVGIYADNNASRVRIAGNTVSDVDFGMQVHNSDTITLDSNTLFGNRRYQLWIQEDTAKTSAGGDVHDLVVSGNRFFPTVRSSILRTGTTRGADTVHLARFSGNLYSSVFTDWAVLEYTPSTSFNYTLPQWQAAATSAGVPRGNDAGARVAAPLSGYALSTAQASILPNADFPQAARGWSKWNTGSTVPALAVQQCAGSTAPCAMLTAGGTASSLSSPTFSISKDRYYRYTFDAAASVDGLQMKTMARRAGPSSYAGLEIDVKVHSLGVAWKRFSVTFKATADGIPNAATGDLGSRLDFLEVPVGQTVWLRSIELTPLDIDANLVAGAAILANADTSTASINCPDAGTALQYRCASYLKFPEGLAVQWPLQLQPRQSQIVFVQNTSLVDGDGDSVPDSQDACPATPAGQTVNARGCSIQQAP